MSIDIRGSIRMRIGAVGGGGIPIAAEYQALLDEFVVAPSAADQVAQNLFVKTLVDGGVWAEADRLLILASHASGRDSLLDWIHPAVTGNVATLQNMTVSDWTMYRGYLSDGTTKYINSNYNPTQDAVNGSVNDTALYMYGRFPNPDGNSAIYGSLQGGQRWIKPGTIFGIDDWASQCNLHSNGGSASHGTDWLSEGGIGSARYGASSWAIYRNGVYSTDTYATTTYPDYDQYILGCNNSGTAIWLNTFEASIVFDGGSLTEGQFNILHDAFHALMTHYGTQV